MKIALLILNSAIFYGAWIFTLIRAEAGDPYTGALIILAVILFYLVMSKNRKKEALFFALVTLLGTGVDSIWTSSQLIYYKTGYSCPNIAPLWISALWLLFAYACATSLYWLEKYPWLAALFGAVGGPLTYYGSFKLDVGDPVKPLPVVLGILAVAWFFLMPATLYLRRLIVNENEIEPTET